MLIWLCRRYDKKMQILDEIRTEGDRIAFLKSAAEQLLVRASGSRFPSPAPHSQRAQVGHSINSGRIAICQSWNGRPTAIWQVSSRLMAV